MTMPTIAAAAFERIRAEMELMPATSTTDAIIAMSTAPTYGDTSPEATVETISFGSPIGSARMAAVAIVVLPDPPAASTPSHRFVACSASTVARAPSAIADTAAPRSPASRSCCQLRAAGARHLVGRDGREVVVVLADAAVDDDHVDAAVTETIAEERALGALRVERPDQDDGGHRSTCRDTVVRPEHEVALAVRHVVERHRAERLEERHAAGGEQLVLEAAVDDDDVAGRRASRVSPSMVMSTEPSTIAMTCSRPRGGAA